MSIFIDLLRLIILWAIFTLTIRWIILQIQALRLKSAQKEPLDRMICISSNEILKGVVRKRTSKAGCLVYKWFIQFYELDKDNETMLDSIFESMSSNDLNYYIIPNEDIHKAKKMGMLSDPSKYYLNDEIIIRLSKIEKKEIEKEKEEKKKKEKEKEIEALEFKKMKIAEEQKRLKEKEIEDQINI